MKSHILFLFFIGLILSSGTLYAEEPFSMGLDYDLTSQTLKISLERLSRDELDHFMNRLVIQRGELPPIEESMVEQNHLHKITKYIPVSAAQNDVIRVILHYGDEEIFERSIPVGVAPGTILERSAGELNQNKSVIIKADMYTEKVDILQADPDEDATGIISAEKVKSQLPAGADKSYGFRGYGFESKDSSYGVSEQDTGIYGKDVGQKPYGHASNDPSYGVSDVGHKDVGLKPYGQSGYGVEGDAKPYGTKDHYEKKD